MFKAEVDLAVLVEHLISKFTGVMPIKPLLLIAHHPLCEPEIFNQEVRTSNVIYFFAETFETSLR
jgi:hypothetical protein